MYTPKNKKTTKGTPTLDYLRMAPEDTASALVVVVVVVVVEVSTLARLAGVVVFSTQLTLKQTRVSGRGYYVQPWRRLCAHLLSAANLGTSRVVPNCRWHALAARERERERRGTCNAVAVSSCTMAMIRHTAFGAATRKTPSPVGITGHRGRDDGVEQLQALTRCTATLGSGRRSQTCGSCRCTALHHDGA